MLKLLVVDVEVHIKKGCVRSVLIKNDVPVLYKLYSKLVGRGDNAGLRFRGRGVNLKIEQ